MVNAKELSAPVSFADHISGADNVKLTLAQRPTEAFAAAAPGKIWKMHCAHLKQEVNLRWEGLRDAAKVLNLVLARFEVEVTNHTDHRKIQEHVHRVLHSGFASTCSDFVNGAFYGGADNYDDFAALIRKFARAR